MISLSTPSASRKQQLEALLDPEAIRKELSERSLREFIRFHWHAVEPLSRSFVDGWHIDAICEHLEAVTAEEIPRLLINVPPGCMKSLTTDVFWPAWEWGPCGLPETRYVATSYTQGLTIRDNQRFLQVIRDRRYQANWGDEFALSREGEIKIQNDKTGWKLATSVGGVGTGERGDRVIIDDPHNVKDGESEAIRESTLRWFAEVMPTRLNDPLRSAIIVIMQRVHENDVSGLILAKELGYEHLMLPMRYDAGRHCTTSIGFSDPREVEGDLIWPERMPAAVVDRDERVMGPYAVAGQFQQSPEPRGGGIIKREWWRAWDTDLALQYGLIDQAAVAESGDAALKFPEWGYRIASLDTAYGLKEENDWSALTVWQTWRDLLGNPRVMLVYAWRGRLPLHEPSLTEDEKAAGVVREGLVEKVAFFCKRYKVERLLVEAKSTGVEVAREIQRLHQPETWSISLVDPKGVDKVARAYAVQPLFSAGLIYAPASVDGTFRAWAEMVVSECSTFPKGAHDDLVDSTTQALRHLRLIGLAPLAEERQAEADAKAQFRPKKGAAIYPV